jgi:diaminopimelate epimerase
MTGVRGDAVDVPLALASGERLVVTGVSVGNRTASCSSTRPTKAPAAASARRSNDIRRSPADQRPARRAVDRGTVDVRIWERGAGYARVGVVVVRGRGSGRAYQTLRPGLRARDVPGGALGVDVRPDWSIRLDGPAVEVFTGAFDPVLLAPP